MVARIPGLSPAVAGLRLSASDRFDARGQMKAGNTMAAEALEKSALENKDKDQLLAIAQALGVAAVSRASKATLIEKILEKTATPASPPSKSGGRDANGSTRGEGTKSSGSSEKGGSAKSEKVMLGPDGEPLAEWEIELAEHEGRLSPEDAAEAREARQDDRGGDRNSGQQRNDRGDRNREPHGQRAAGVRVPARDLHGRTCGWSSGARLPAWLAHGATRQGHPAGTAEARHPRGHECRPLRAAPAAAVHPQGRTCRHPA
ncbi:MAG: transcription termination factor Rho [Actinomycetota bacterium]